MQCDTLDCQWEHTPKQQMCFAHVFLDYFDIYYNYIQIPLFLANYI